jgi:protein TonB
MVRLIALLLSALIHGVVGFAIWPRLQKEELEVLDFGTGQDIELMPQGIVISDVSNRGDDVQSIEARDVVPVDRRQPKPQPADVKPPKQLRDLPDRSARTSTDDIAAVHDQMPVPKQAAIAPPAQLHDDFDHPAKTTTADAASIDAQQPAPKPVEVAPREQLRDVIDHAARARPEVAAAVPEQRSPTKPVTVAPLKQLHDVGDAVETEKTREEVAPLKEQTPAPRSPAVVPAEQLHDATVEEKSTVKQEAIKAAETPLPDPLKEPISGKSGALAPPDQLKESKVAQIERPSPPKPIEPPLPPKLIEPQKPEAMEVEAAPAQIAVVTEQSSGEKKEGGDARTVGIYLGKVNERVQRSKVNPHSRLAGVVVVTYRIGRDGTLLSKEVSSSSGSPVLDDAALSTVDRAAPFPPIPPEVSRAAMAFTQSFRFIVR